MTAAELKKRIAALRRVADDDEVAHGLEDELRHKVLEAIADGTALDPKSLAREVLKTSQISFARWCA